MTAGLEEDRPPEWLLSADSLYREYIEESVEVVLDHLLPEKARLTLSAKDHTALAENSLIVWQKEKWYGTEYAVQKFGPGTLEKVCSRVLTVTTNGLFRYSASSHSRVASTTP